MENEIGFMKRDEHTIHCNIAVKINRASNALEFLVTLGERWLISANCAMIFDPFSSCSHSSQYMYNQDFPLDVARQIEPQRCIKDGGVRKLGSMPQYMKGQWNCAPTLCMGSGAKETLPCLWRDVGMGMVNQWKGRHWMWCAYDFQAEEEVCMCYSMRGKSEHSPCFGRGG